LILPLCQKLHNFSLPSVQFLAEGKSMKEVASVLHVTPRTVAFHKYRVMEELNLETTAELISVRYKITNSHNVNPTKSTVLHCSIAVPAFLLLRFIDVPANRIQDY